MKLIPRCNNPTTAGQKLTSLLGITDRLTAVSVLTEEFVNVTVITPDGQAKVVPAPVDPTYVLQ